MPSGGFSLHHCLTYHGSNANVLGGGALQPGAAYARRTCGAQGRRQELLQLPPGGSPDEPGDLRSLAAKKSPAAPEGEGEVRPIVHERNLEALNG